MRTDVQYMIILHRKHSDGKFAGQWGMVCCYLEQCVGNGAGPSQREYCLANCKPIVNLLVGDVVTDSVPFATATTLYQVVKLLTSSSERSMISAILCVSEKKKHT